MAGRIGMKPHGRLFQRRAEMRQDFDAGLMDLHGHIRDGAKLRVDDPVQHHVPVPEHVPRQPARGSAGKDG